MFEPSILDHWFIFGYYDFSFIKCCMLHLYLIVSNNKYAFSQLCHKWSVNFNIFKYLENFKGKAFCQDVDN